MRKFQEDKQKNIIKKEGPPLVPTQSFKINDTTKKI